MRAMYKPLFMILVATVVGATSLTLAQGCAAGKADEPTDKSSSLPHGVSVEGGLLRFRGEVVHPGAFLELTTSLADPRPVACAVDLEGCQRSNKYSPTKPLVSGRNVRYSYTPASDGMFDYELVGVAPSGTAVVEIADSGGGSGVFMSLLLVRFQEETFLQYDKRLPRVIMKSVGVIGLGDRYGGRVTMKGNRITIGKEEGDNPHHNQPEDRVVEVE